MTPSDLAADPAVKALVAEAGARGMEPQWRSVKDDPPPKDGTLFLGVWGSGASTSYGVICWKGGFWHEEASDMETATPRFWQPIDESPALTEGETT